MTEPSLLVFSEEAEAVPGLVAAGRAALAGAPGRIARAVLVGASGEGGPVEGIDRVYRLASPNLHAHAPENVGRALARAVELARPTLVLVASTKRGREYAAHLAALVDGAVTTGVTELSIVPEGVRVRREVLSGNAIGQELIVGRLPIVALMPTAPSPPSPAAAASAAPESVDVPLDLPPERTVLVERTVKPAGGLRIEAAERIVAVGRGLKKKEDLALIEGLAKAMGAVVGCTRPIAAEAGWLSDDHWIGLTGHRVKPTLYVAVGLSGAVQHLVGMRESKVVVAINRDPNAPIFAQSDFRLTGDLYAIVPALVKALGSP